MIKKRHWDGLIVSVTAFLAVGDGFAPKLFVCFCFASLQQQGHLETAPPFTVPFEIHRSNRESNPRAYAWQSISYRCAT